MTTTPREKLRAAVGRQEVAELALVHIAALHTRRKSDTTRASLRDAAIKYTNAYHQASRCAKHVRDGRS